MRRTMPVLLAALLLAALLLAGCGDDPGTRGPLPAASTPAPATSPVTTRLPAAADGAEIVTKFLATWIRPDLTADQWQAVLHPLCTPAFAATLRYDSRVGVPGYVLSGPPKLARQPATGVAVYQVPSLAESALDDGKSLPPPDRQFVVTLNVHDGAWKVSAVEFASTRR